MFMCSSHQCCCDVATGDKAVLNAGAGKGSPRGNEVRCGDPDIGLRGSTAQRQPYRSESLLRREAKRGQDRRGLLAVGVTGRAVGGEDAGTAFQQTPARNGRKHDIEGVRQALRGVSRQLDAGYLSLEPSVELV